MTDVIAGRFALHDPIAQGGSGVVWRAFDTKRGAYCSLQVLRRRDAGALLRFVREQSVRLSHPRVLPPYSWAAEDDHVAIAGELVDPAELVVSYLARNAPAAALLAAAGACDGALHDLLAAAAARAAP